MNNHERAARLMEEAIKRGCDTPTESMIAEAIYDAEEQRETEVAGLLVQLGFSKAADALVKARELQFLEDAEA